MKPWWWSGFRLLRFFQGRSFHFAFSTDLWPGLQTGRSMLWSFWWWTRGLNMLLTLLSKLWTGLLCCPALWAQPKLFCWTTRVAWNIAQYSTIAGTRPTEWNKDLQRYFGIPLPIFICSTPCVSAQTGFSHTNQIYPLTSDLKEGSPNIVVYCHHREKMNRIRAKWILIITPVLASILGIEFQGIE